MAKRDSAWKTAAAKRGRPGRRQQWIRADIVLAWVDMLLDLVKHGEYLMSCRDGMKNRVLHGNRVTAYDTMDALEAARICYIVAKEPWGTPVRGHY